MKEKLNLNAGTFVLHEIVKKDLGKNCSNIHLEQLYIFVFILDFFC